MAIHQIIKMGNPILREISRELTSEEILSPEIKTLISDMWETMEHAGGIGLAAPQISIPLQLTVIRVPKDSERYPESEESDEFVIFNPKITYLTEETQGFWEGCLSVPGLRGFVERPKKIRVDYLDQEAKPQSIELDDFLATVFQHELDHLIGKLYVDRIKDITTLMYEDALSEEISEDEES